VGVLAGKDSQVGFPVRFSVSPGSSHDCMTERKMEFATSVTIGSIDFLRQSLSRVKPTKLSCSGDRCSSRTGENAFERDEEFPFGIEAIVI